MKYLFLLVLFSGCSSVSQVLEPNVFYMRDVSIEANGHKGVGTLVVPKNGSYDLKLGFKGKLDLLSVTSCHRDIVKEEAYDKGLFSDKSTVKLTVSPTKIESRQYCPWALGGYEKIKGRHAWGFVDFETEEATLPAVVRCNGNEYNSRGVTVCQSKEGLLQEIEFPEKASFVANACGSPETKDGKVFLIRLSRGECVYAFMGESKRVHRLTTLGYEQVLLRSD